MMLLLQRIIREEARAELEHLKPNMGPTIQQQVL